MVFELGGPQRARICANVGVSIPLRLAGGAAVASWLPAGAFVENSRVLLAALKRKAPRARSTPKIVLECWNLFQLSFAQEFECHGYSIEWHVVLRKSFEHLAFEHLPRLHHTIVFLLPPLSLPWLEAIGSVGDSMGSRCVEQLVV